MIVKLTQILNNRNIFLILYGALLALALIPYYSQGCLILGGEGDYVLNFLLQMRQYGFAWHPIYSIGIPNFAPGGVGLNILLLCLIEGLTGNIAITNFILIFAIYFLPFFAMYLVCKSIDATPFISFLCSFFYIVNPFMLYYLTSLNQANVFSVTVMPLFLWAVLKYYHNNFKLFFTFGFISTCFSFTYSNPPLFIIIHISIILSTVIASYYYHKKFILTETVKKYSILLLSFILFNSWWLLCLFLVIPDAKKLYIQSFANSWLDTTVNKIGPIIAKMFSFVTMIGEDPSHDFFTYWYGTIFARFITIFPLFMLIYFILMVKRKRPRNTLIITILSMLLVTLFFVKGNGSPFGFIYNYMFKHVPFFYIFKSPVEKFGLLYVFIFSLLLLFVIKNLTKHKYYKPMLGSFIIYLVFCSMPIFTGNIIPDYNIRREEGRYASRKYKDKAEYKQFREEMNKDISEYRILSLPGSGNYQVCMLNWNGKYYTGLDPVLLNINKPLMASYAFIYTDAYMSNLFFKNISFTNYKKLLAIYTVKKIMINEDLFPWFGFVERERTPILKKIFGKFMQSKKWGSITLYDNENYFLPHIYASDSNSTMVEGNSNNGLIILASTKYLDGRPALFFNKQVEEKENDLLNKVNNIVLYDSLWQDFAGEEVLQKRANPTAYIFATMNRASFLVEKDRLYDLKIKLIPKDDVYPVKGDSEKTALIKIDNKIFSLNDFVILEEHDTPNMKIVSKGISRARGEHVYEKLDNPYFDIEWVIIEPATSNSHKDLDQAPEITFKRINPTKYLVKIDKAKRPFWLIFSESFNDKWKLYGLKAQGSKIKGLFDEIIMDYPKLKVKEARHITAFTPQDLGLLFQRPIGAPHRLVNGYANGWYIDPKDVNLGEDFALVLYFWPQNLFYLGLIISGITLIGCICYLIRRKNI